MAVPLAPLVWCLVAAALFGASPPAAKALLDSAGPFQLAGLFYLGAAVATAPLSTRGGSRARRGQRRHRLALTGTVLAGGVIGPVLLLMALRAAQASSVSLWLNLEAVATAILAALFFREHLGRRTRAAALLVVSGGVVLAAPAGFAGAAPALLVALACLAWGLDNNLTALIDGLTPAQCTLVKGAVAGPLNLALGGLAGERLPSVELCAAALGVGALAYGISILLYIAGAQQLGATRSQLAFATAPVFGLVLAWTALGEPLSAAQVVAAALMGAGIVLITRDHHRHEHSHPRVTHSHSHTHDDGHHSHHHPGMPAWTRHTHEHQHEPLVHEHDHVPDLHHRHDHPAK
jgi:drug/metabolite transporter (DMT)-like permease